MSKVPVLKGYKQTEVGVIPEDWEICSLKQITLDMLQGVNTAIDKPEYVHDGIPMLKANNVIDGEVVFEGADHISLKTFLGYGEKFKAKKNDFLFSNIGARLGTGSLLKLDVECSFAWNVMRIVPDIQKVIPEYLCFLINSPKCSQNIKSKQSGSGMGFVPKGVMQGIVFAIPKRLEEQTAIATVLSDTDALIENLKKLIVKKKAIKQGAMQQLITGKKRLPGFSGEWDAKKLKELGFDISDGNYSSKYPKASEFKEIGVAFIRANNIKRLTVIGDDMRFISKELHSELTKGHLKQDDILITTRGEIGQIAIVPQEYIGSNINAQIVRINTNNKINKYYFTYFLLKLETQKILLNLQTGSALKQLPIGKLMDLQVIYPSIEEQITIAAILSDMDAEIESLEQKRDKYLMIKQGMMQALLTGKVWLISPTDIGATK